MRAAALPFVLLLGLAPTTSLAQTPGEPKTPYDEPAPSEPAAPAAEEKPAEPGAPQPAPPAPSGPGATAPPPAPSGPAAPSAPPPAAAPPPMSTAPAAPPAAPAWGAPPPAYPPAPAPFDNRPAPPRDRGPDYRLIFGTASAVVGAGFLVTLAVSAARLSSLQDEPAFETYRRGLSPEESACDAAAAGRVVNLPGAATPGAVDDLCSEAQTFEILSYVSLPAGLVFLGVGGFLIFTSDTVRGRSASVEIVPRIGSADVVVRF